MEMFKTVFSLSIHNNQLDAKSFAFYWIWKGILFNGGYRISQTGTGRQPLGCDLKKTII